MTGSGDQDKHMWLAKSISSTLLLEHKSLSVHTNSVFCLVRLTAFMIYDMTLLQSLNVFYAPKKCLCFIKNKLSCSLRTFYVFRTRISLSSWKQTGNLPWKWLPMFMAVLSVPINHEYSDCIVCVCLSVRGLFVAVSRDLYICGHSMSLVVMKSMKELFKSWVLPHREHAEFPLQTKIG